MKTGFVNAFVNKPLNKNYSYHGILKPCNVQPNPEPFEDFPNDYTASVWELFIDKDFDSSRYTHIRARLEDIYPSSDEDVCVTKWPDGKNRYYFCEMQFYGRVPPQWMVLTWSNGLNCDYKWVKNYGTYMYKAWFDKWYAASDVICYVYKSKIGSHVKVWRSSTGEFPGYYPVPPDYYVY